MAVIFVNRFFYPDLSATSQLLSDLAFEVARSSRRMHVITSRLRYDTPPDGPSLPSREIVDDVTIHRVWTSGFGRARLLGRAVDYLTFYASAFWRLLCIARAGDVVVAKTDPPLISVVAAIASALRGARLVNWLQDLFPEVAEADGVGGAVRLAYPALRAMRTWSLQRAASNVVIGQTMAERVAALGVPRERIELVANWSDGNAVRPIAHADNPFRREIAAADAFVVAYSGNLGRVHEIETFLDAMRRLAPSEGGAPVALRWLFIGGGALTARLQAEVARLGLADVTFLPYQPRSALAQSLSAADAHLACLRPAFEGLIVPSKVSGATAAGRPLLFVGDPDGEIGRLVARHAIGYAIAPGDGAGLARAITELAGDPARAADMGRRARATFELELDRGIAFAHWARILDSVDAAPR